MTSFRNLVWVALVVISARAQAEPAFEVSGMHTQMVFSDAVARAEKFGGVCELDKIRRSEGGVVALCEYPSCIEERPSEECDKQSQQSPKLTVAAQPITRIAFEAPAASSSLTLIYITFEGSVDGVEENLKREYGQPDNDTAANAEKSWTHARRLHWTAGNDRLGLRVLVKTIMLATKPVRQHSESDAT
jgi:hypothetical protein